MPFITNDPVVEPFISNDPEVSPEELQTREAVEARIAAQKSRLDPMAYARGAVQGISDFADQIKGANKEILNRMANPAVPETPAEAALTAGLSAFGPAARALGPDLPKVAFETALRGASDLGQIGKDVVESQALDPYRVVRQAVKDEGFIPAAGKLISKAPQLLTPGLDKTAALLQVFPTQAAEVIRQAQQRSAQQAQDREALQKGDRSQLGEVATAIASQFTDNPILAEEIGKAVSPPKDLAQTIDLASNLADPSVLESRLVKLGTRVGNVVAPTLTKQMSTPILEMGGKAAKVAAAQEAKDRLSQIVDNNRKAWTEAVQRSDVSAPPLQTPPRQLFAPSEVELAKALFSERAAQAGQKGSGLVQQGVGAAGRAAETGGKLIESAAGKLDEVTDKYEGPLSLASTVAGASGGVTGALMASQLPGAVRKITKWSQNASRAGTALRTIANTDWESSIPVWRQIAKDPDAPQWLVRGVTANIAGKLKAGEIVEKGLRVGGDLGKGILEGAATDAVLTGMDTSKSGEEIGGEAGTGALFGAVGTAPALKSMSNERKALAFSYDSMRKASESIAAGADPLVIAATPDATMHSSVILESMFRGMLPGRKDLKVDLMDGAQFAKASSDPGAAAYFDESTGRIAVNLESIDADGRQLHEVGHALMSSVAGSNPAIVQHFQQLLGADGLARARQDYQQALGRTVPQDDAFIVGELFSEALANGLRGANLNEALPTVLGRTQTQSFFRDADVRKAIKDPNTLELVRQQFQAASEFRPAVDMEKEPGVKLRPAQAGNHPALPTETRADGTQGNDFVDVTNGQARETPVPVVRARVRSRRREVLGLFPDVPPSGNVNPQASNVGVRQGPSGMTEKTGTRLGEQFYATARSFGDGTKNMLRRVEQAIANNETLAGWYQQIGEGDGWSASVRESLGAMEAQYKDFMPFAFKVDKQGNLLVQNYSLSALERKAAGWAGRQGPLSLEMWNGDIGSFRQDVQTYLKNHAEGRPGSDGLGDMKRNLINVFLVGGNRTFEALNPLRAQAKGRDRQGIVRSYRADRLQTVEPSAITGFEKPDYNKQVRNLTPEVDQQFWEGDSKQFSPAVTGEQPNFTPPQKTIKAYKLFRTLKSRPGELFPLFIGKGESVPVGEWIPAKFIPTKGFAERPGWHAGVLPNAPHLLSKDGTMPSDRVWAEVEIPADVDWQSKANATSTGDIKSEVPAGGYYTFKRPGLQGGSWVIGGALKVNRLLSNADVDKIMSDAGASTSAPVSGQVRNSPPVKLNKKTAIQINSYNHAQQLFDRGYTLYGASNDGFDDSPNLIRTSDEIDRYDPENMVAMVPKSGDPVRNSPNVQTDTPEFKKWFSGSSVVNEDGSPRVMYHGTISSDIGAFRSNRARGQIAGHFAFEPDFASDFALSGHWNVIPEEGINPSVYPVYLNVKKVFDVRDPKARSEMTRLGEPTNRGYDWTVLERPEFVRELRSKGYDGYLDFEAGDRMPPTGIAVFNPTQIKSAIGNTGEFDPNNPDIRYTPKVDRNLVALHNTTEEGIRAALKLGGIPVPSLGVTKKDKAFTGFGNITLIADKAAVDPQADPRNRLYNADVYSPRQPRPFQAVSKGGRDRLSKRINALKPRSLETWNDISSGERAYDQVLEKGPNNVADTTRNLVRSLDVQAAFLTEKGVQVPRLMKDPDLSNRVLDRDSLSDPRLAVLLQHPDDLYDFLKTPEGIAVGDDIRKLVFEERGGAVGDLSPEQRQRLNALTGKNYGAPGTPFPFRDADSILSDLSTIADGSKKVVDRFGITEWVRDQIKSRESEFSKWVDGLTADIFEPDQKLVRGTKKVPYTLENVTDAMTGKVRGQEEGGLTHSLGRARSESAVQFRDLDQARAAEGSLMTREGLEPLRRERQNQFDQVVEALAPFDKYPDRNGFDRLDNLSEAMGKIAKRPASAASVLASFDYTGISPQVLLDVRKFALSLRDDPTEYFESKPQRAVGLSEFKAAIVPEGTSPDVVDALKQAGLAVETYTDNANRIAAVERVSSEKDLLFSPKVSFDQPSDKVMDTSAINLLHGTSTVLPPGTKEAPKTLDTIAKNLQEAAVTQWGRIINSYDITPAEYEVIADNAMNECVAALQASGKNAFDWYTTAIARASVIMSVLHPELKDDAAARASGVFPNAKAAHLGMTMAMAITSQNLSVDSNSQYAEEQFSHLLKTGKFDPEKEYGTKATSISSNLALANVLIEKLGWEGADKFLAESFTVKELSEVAKQIRGKKVTISGRAEDIVQGAALFGPKIGQGFLQNLRGNYVPVTIDLWMRRTWGRWTGDVMEIDPLTPERVSRLLEGARAKGLVLPQQMKTMRTVARSRKGGSTYTTLSDALVEKIRDDRGLRDVIFSVTEDLVKEWGNRYKSVKKFAVRPEDLKAVRDGSLSFDALTDRQMAILKRLDVQYGRYVEQQKTAPEGTEKLPKDLWRQSQLQALGHTEMLTNKDISNIKPEWASSAIVIQNALGPIDVPNDQDREVITRLVNDIRGRLKQQGIETTNADIQAILWYPEKDIWAKLSDGTSDSDLKQSYDTEFLKIAEARGLGDQARAALQQAESDRTARTGSSPGAGETR